MSYIKKHIFFLLLILAFIQCRKDEPIPFCEQFPDQCEAVEGIKDHYYFKEGSWWVYEEQNTGAIDSQWVETSQLATNNKDFKVTIRSSRHDYDLHRWTNLLSPAQASDIVEKRKLAYIKRAKTKAGDFIGESYIGIFYPIVGEEVANPNVNFTNNKLAIKNVYTKYSQLDFNYDFVVEYYENSDKTENNQKVKTFYAEDVGLIKKELIDSNQIWELKKYNVIQ